VQRREEMYTIEQDIEVVRGSIEAYASNHAEISMRRVMEHIQKLQDKLHRRNLLVNNLRREIGELKKKLKEANATILKPLSIES
jgi:predicted  nucleic acid-binding Zn-ribbon protein